MKHVRDAVEHVIRGDNRSYNASVIFSFLSVQAEAVEIQSPNAVRGCVPDQIVYPYLSHIEDRAFTNLPKNRRVFPHAEMIHADGRRRRVTKRPYARIGYIGKKADNLGLVSDTITLYVPNIETKRFTLVTNPDRIIDSAAVILQDNQGTPIAQYNIIGNTRSRLDFDVPCQNVYRIVLHIEKHTPNRRIWLVAFYPGFEFKVENQDIISIKQSVKKTENKEASIGRLYIKSLDVTLNNILRTYDSQNKISPVSGFFNSNTSIKAHLTLKQKNTADNFIYNFGTYWITDVKTEEAKPTVHIKAQDYVGVHKSQYLSLGVFDDTDTKHMFGETARALGLSPRIDPSLDRIKLHMFSLNGTASALLNKLCVLSNAFCSVSLDGTALEVKKITSRHGVIRYPCRYFNLNEYNSSASGNAASNSPNIINLSYTKDEYEQSFVVKNKKIVMYKDIPVREYPDKWLLTPLIDRIPGAEQEPSTVLEFVLPDNFAGVEFSDGYVTTIREYDTTVDYEAKKITVSVWVFQESNDEEQLTVAVMVKQKPAEITLKTENIEVPARPKEYVVPSGEAPSPLYTDILQHNFPNIPVECTVSIKDAVSISRVEIANKFIARTFEFAHRKTGEGIHIKVWNYTAVPQTLTCIIYGNRLIAGKESKTITARNEADIQKNGEIIKNLSVGSLASDTIAKDILHSSAYFYRHFFSSESFSLWADPRLELYDLIACKSLRGYGYTQGIIEEMELEYKGSLRQKIKTIKTKKHNRDSRIFGAYVAADRPVLPEYFLGYA
ncbi:hypothetical protein V1L52_10025 [Treponema sp. HNW]|uniref:hypothetical protein n=1 Tax=Treponema sp. HNW TaxID=3116654 RepID=UPI003D0EEC23